jgi:hypothetical protein
MNAVHKDSRKGATEVIEKLLPYRNAVAAPPSHVLHLHLIAKAQNLTISCRLA